MKPLSVVEVQNLALELKTLEGARLQEARLSTPLLALGFYQHGELYWVVLDLAPQAPQVVVLNTLAGLPLRDEKKPLSLFLRAHFVGHQLRSVDAPLDLGRVLNLRLGGPDASTWVTVEARLFPRGQNVILHAHGKDLALAKPAELKPIENVPDGVAHAGGVLQAKTEEWLAQWQQKKPSGPAVAAAPGKNTKVERAIAKVLTELEAKRSLRWGDAGEWLKALGHLDGEKIAAGEFTKYFDLSKNFAWNLETCFRKSREVRGKIVSTEKRLAQLQRELTQAQKSDGDDGEKTLESPRRAERKAPDDVKGRRFDLGDGLTFFVGKSAQDNLRLLRAAKAWDFWLHLRDVPSCHGILHRQKNQAVSEAQLHLAAHHLVAKNFGEKHKDRDGEKFDVLVTECRFVRPIKGDKVGRVTYSDERVFSHRHTKKS